MWVKPPIVIEPSFAIGSREWVSRVLILDGDLGMANVDILFGMCVLAQNDPRRRAKVTASISEVLFEVSPTT